MRLTRLCILVLSCSFYFSSWATDENLTLLVYGDSLSASYGIEEEKGWVNLLRSKLLSKKFAINVVNGSVSGETTTGGLARLPAMLDSYQPALVILELGGNDGLRGLPLDLMRENLASMIDLAKASGAEVILTGIQIPPNYGPRYTVPFFDIYAALAEKNALPFVPFLIEGIVEQPELMQSDGIHPRAEAQWMILDNVWPILETELESLLKN